jgi:hypothetical protein
MVEEDLVAQVVQSLDSVIVLIPKNEDPKKVIAYRAISLSNVIYKLIIKLLANRLK